MNNYEAEKNAKFLSYWEKKRENKRNIYLQYALVWGLIISSLVYLFTLRFNLDNIVFTDLVLRWVFWGLGGLIVGHLHVRAQEKQYQKLTTEKEA